MTWYNRQNDPRLQILKFNPYHDANTGRFTSGGGASLASGAKATTSELRGQYNNPYTKPVNPETEALNKIKEKYNTTYAKPGDRSDYSNPTGLKARPGGKSLPSRAPVTIQSAQEVLASHGYSMGDPHVDLKTGMTTYTVTDQKGNSQAVSAKNLRTFLDGLKAGVAAKPKITPKNVPTSPSTFTSRALRGVRRAVSNYFDLSDTTDL